MTNMIKHWVIKATSVALVCISCMTAHAAEFTPIDIPAGELAQALRTLAKQAGVELFYQTDVVKGLRTKGVTGTLSAQDAVSKILEGTPLVLKTDSSGAMLIGLPG